MSYRAFMPKQPISFFRSKKSSASFLPRRIGLLACSAIIATPLYPALATATPKDGKVIAGEAEIGTPSSKALTIDQSSKNAIIEWGGFSIGKGNSVQFNNGSGATLNRVTGSDVSSINGSLKASGSVFLINGNGVIIGRDGVVSTGGSFVASTLDVSNSDFMDGGDLTFRGSSDASVINLGKVSSLGGDVGFLAHSVVNEGSVTARQGTVGLAAGREILLRDAALDEGKFAVKIGSPGSSVLEKGMINAASVELRASGGNIYALAGNTNGSINATGIAKKGGRIFLTAGAGGSVVTAKKITAKRNVVTPNQPRRDGGDIFINADLASVGGLFDLDGATGGTLTIDATTVDLTARISAQGESGLGGRIDIGASETITLAGASLDVSGATGGGRIRVGGEFQGGRNLATDEVQNAQTLLIDAASTLRADGTGANADGGMIIAWADGTTTFEGNLSATGKVDGGFAEVSGKDTLEFGGLVSLKGLEGVDGTLLLDPTNFTIDAATASNIITALATANVVISTDAAGADAGDIFITSAVDYSSANDLTLLAHRNIIASASVQNSNASGGDINLVAGWDGTTGAPSTTGAVFSPYTFNAALFDAIDVNAVASIYGNSNGSVSIGGGIQSSTVAVGSRSGATRVYGYDLLISANANGGAQLGFRVVNETASYAVTGSLSANVINNLSATSSFNLRERAYAQLGHGGLHVNGDLTVDAAISANITLSVGNDVSVSGAAGNSSYAQLGHGGTSTDGNHSGDITIVTANDVNFQGGSGSDSYALFGHGGAFGSGSMSGTITVRDVNDLNFRGGSGARSFAQLGHGGANARGNHSGSIIIETANDLNFQGGANSAAAQLGNGGNSAVGNHSGAITIGMVNDLNFSGGTGGTASAQLGHGGYLADGNHSGAILVSAARNLSFVGGTGGSAYAQLGHGSADIGGALQARGTRQGNVSVTLKGEASFVDGSPAGVDLNFGFLGHSSDTLNGISDADIFLQATAIDDSTNAVAPGGNGTLHGDLLTSALSGGNVTIQVTESGLVLPRGQNVSYNSGNNLLLMASHDLTFNSSVQGSSETSGEINLVAGWDGVTAFSATGFDAVDVNAAASIYGNNTGSVIIGDGSQTSGVAVGSRSAATRVYGYDLLITAGTDGDDRYAQLGFQVNDQGASYAVTGALSASVLNDIQATGGDSDNRNYAQLGHGGADRTANATEDAAISAEIIVSAGNNLIFTGGSGSRAYSQLGHGGYFTVGSQSGAVSVRTAHDLIFTGGSGAASYAQLGHGGGLWGDSSFTRTISGAIMIETVRDLIFTAGSDYAQLGHGGRSAVGDLSGDITIGTARDLILTGGSSLQSYAQLGHGGFSAFGDYLGDITIETARDLTLAGGNRDDAYAQLGHGHAVSNFIKREGDISVTLTGEASFINGSGTGAPGFFGHVSEDANGISNADIFLQAAAIDDSANAVAPGGNGTLRSDILMNALSGGNVTIQVTESGLVLPSGQNVSYDGDNSLLLTASHDITLNGALQNSSARGGDVTIKAGRSVFVGADVATGNGDLTLEANADVDGDRTTGTAEITVSDGVTINAGSGAIHVELADGAANSNGDAGNVTFVGNNSVTAARIDVLNSGVEAANEIVLETGTAINASGSGDALVLASDIFTNNAGNGALSTSGGGRFLVYSRDWDDDTRGGLAGGNLYNRTYAGNPPSTITQSGDQFIYARQPILTVTVADITRIYGNANPSFSASYSGLVNGDTLGNAISGVPSITTPAVLTSDIGTYAITAGLGSLLSDQGYGFAFVDGVLSVTPRALTLTANDVFKIQDGKPFSGGGGVFGKGFVGGDDLGDLKGMLTYAGSSQGAFMFGDYVILPGGVTSKNYDISFVGGTLTIAPLGADIQIEEEAAVQLSGAVCLNDLLSCPSINADQIMPGVN